ncbi:hypothetical protein [Paenibacillus sp. DMB5]|uniref:hypothetical protein n=1 Tax=Paenibacillus sp. DMB5 TaxID=1780103 RepID=UPI00076C8BD6|nr:hypothetical protein [Paenibacillus sp. DMB5]KUP24485.1 hypothetical protein AWJ19_22445 [Paenibacillus sp. DMB5]
MRPAAAESAYPDDRDIRLPIPEDDSPYCLQVSASAKDKKADHAPSPDTQTSGKYPLYTGI